MLVLSVLIGVTALGQVLGLVPLAWPLIGLDERLPVIFRLHMAASGLAIIVITFAAALRRRPTLHRPLGRLAAALVVVGGLSALPSALLSEAHPMARTGFFVQGLVWLGLIIAGFVAIRRRRRDAHAALMLLMASVASGAVVLRLAMALIVLADVPYEPGYAVAAWLAWLVPLGATMAVLAWHRLRQRALALQV
jgi:hypothetical protein